VTEAIRLETLREENVADYERLTRDAGDGRACFCGFWHQKWASMEEYHGVQRTNPTRLRDSVLDRMRARFHVGVIAYEKDNPCAWVSVGPLIDFFWAWRRVAQLGEVSRSTAGILCFTVAPDSRGRGMQERVLAALTAYGKGRGWTAIEAYPFAPEAIEKHGPSLRWPGLAAGYERAGFQKRGDHWLSQPDAGRHIYSLSL
jgi:GNAT superfamily N-acetyltransferase